MASIINLCPHHAKPALRRCRVPDLWGKIKMDWHSNFVLTRDKLQSRQDSGDSKMVLKPCSLRAERFKLSSSSLVWGGVEKVKVEDATVQLMYHGVRVRDAGSDAETGILDEGRSEKKDKRKINWSHKESHNLSLKCPKCDQVFNGKRSLICHTVSHYYKLFFKVLPNREPFPCPICDKVHKNRVTLARHYAITHRKIFGMTDLTPEDLPGIKMESIIKWSKPKLMNNNCRAKDAEQNDEKVVDDGHMSEFEKNDKDNNEEQIGMQEETQPLVQKCPKCGQVFSNKRSMCSHVVSHYYELLFKVLPNIKPFPCPSCGKVHRDRIGLARHFALTHRKIFDMTDLTPEDLPGIGKGSGVKLSKSKLPTKDVLMNINFPEEKSKQDEKVMDDELVKSEEDGNKIELSDADDQISCHKSPKSESETESVETIAVGSLETEDEVNMEDGYPTTILHSVQGIISAPFSGPEDSVSQVQEKNLDSKEKDMDDDDELGDLSAPFWANDL